MYSQNIKKFCNMLSSERVVAFSEIDSLTLNTIVKDFRKTCPGSMDQVISSIRQFLGFLNSKGSCTEFKMDPVVYRVPPGQKRKPEHPRGHGRYDGRKVTGAPEAPRVCERRHRGSRQAHHQPA